MKLGIPDSGLRRIAQRLSRVHDNLPVYIIPAEWTIIEKPVVCTDLDRIKDSVILVGPLAVQRATELELHEVPEKYSDIFVFTGDPLAEDLREFLSAEPL